MNLWKSISGMMEVRVTSACPEASLMAISEQNIPMFSVIMNGNLSVNLWIYRRDYDLLHHYCEKRGESLEVIKRKGLYWRFKMLCKRPVLTFGVAAVLISVFLMPKYVFFVQVDGNKQIPTNRILEAAMQCGIHFGATRKDVRSERVKNALISVLPELQWAGVNTKGCVAILSVRERTESGNIKQPNQVSSIVASRDGIVVDCTVNKGTLLCSPGQAVKAGELLISGYTDCDITIQATQAQGEIFAQTVRNLDVIIPKQWISLTEEDIQIGGISLLIGKKRINLWKYSGIWDATYGRMYEEYYVTLPGDFRLPVALCIEWICTYEKHPITLPQLEAEAVLDNFALNALSQHMVAGKVLSEERFVDVQQSVYHMQGNYLCREMIGTVRTEKMGEDYGQTS